MTEKNVASTKGAAIPTIQQAPGYKVTGGAEIPMMQQTPKTPASGNQQTQSSGGTKKGDMK